MQHTSIVYFNCPVKYKMILKNFAFLFERDVSLPNTLYELCIIRRYCTHVRPVAHYLK